MGKWEAFKGKLKPLPVDPGWKKKVDAAKLALLGTKDAGNANVAYLARLLADRKKKKNILEDKISVLNLELEALSDLIVDRQQGEETTSVQLRGGLTVYIKDEPYTSIVDRSAAMRWAKQAGHLYLFSLQWQSLNRLVKTMLTKNQPPPPGVKVYMKSSAHVLGLGAAERDE